MVTMTKTKKTKNWIVVLCEGKPKHWCFLGELDRGLRQGVRKRENAVRFTRVGAVRVARTYGPHQAYATHERGPRLESERDEHHVAGYSNFGGGGPFAPMHSPKRG